MKSKINKKTLDHPHPRNLSLKNRIIVTYEK
jgi:hypothetical protein